jgi:hypothetical protein
MSNMLPQRPPYTLPITGPIFRGIGGVGGGGVGGGGVGGGGVGGGGVGGGGVGGGGVDGIGGSPQQNLQSILQNYSSPNPLQPYYMSNPTMGQATYGTAASMGAAQSSANPYLSDQLMQALSPDSTIGQIYSSFMPQAAQANNALQNQLAAAGIVGGGAIDAQNQLQANLSASLGNALAGAIQNAQGNMLQGSEFGSGQNMQQSLANANFLQQALAQNAGFQQQMGLANMQAGNDMTVQNLRDIIGQQSANTQLANNAQNALANALLNNYYNNFNAFQNVNSAGLNGGIGITQQGLSNAGSLGNIAANAYGISSSSPFAGLGSALGYAFGGGQAQPSTGGGF